MVNDNGGKIKARVKKKLTTDFSSTQGKGTAFTSFDLPVLAEPPFPQLFTPRNLVRMIEVPR